MATTTCNAQDLLAAAACFGCLDNRQLQMLQASLLCQILHPQLNMATCNAQDLITAAKCFGCLDPHQLSMLIAQLLCEILNAGGPSGESCLLCGNADPVADPDCECALYYRVDTMAVWLWDDANTAWKQLAGGP